MYREWGSAEGGGRIVDRREAGRRLAEKAMHLKERDPLVLGLPRGGVVVAAEVARALEAPLDVLVVRKLGAPNRPELAIGAVIDGNPPQRVLNEEIVHMLGVDESFIEREHEQQLAEARRRLEIYRRGRAGLDVAGRTVIVVDDGVATGATMNAALTGLRQADVESLVLAVPVGAPEGVAMLSRKVDEAICLASPVGFRAVGCYYQSFEQTTDEEVVRLLGER
jgi:putative phosphoribosyl transferase